MTPTMQEKKALLPTKQQPETKSAMNALSAASVTCSSASFFAPSNLSMLSTEAKVDTETKDKKRANRPESSEATQEQNQTEKAAVQRVQTIKATGEMKAAQKIEQEHELSPSNMVRMREEKCELESKEAVEKYMNVVNEILPTVNKTTEFLESFQATLKMLCSEWFVRHAHRGGDNTATRQVASILTRLKEPVIIALIGDDARYVEKNTNTREEKSYSWLLNAACICGSVKVANYIATSKKLDDDNISITLAYAISTGKKPFALQIASCLKEKGYQTINPIALCDYDTYEEDGSSIAAQVEKIFTSAASALQHH